MLVLNEVSKVSARVAFNSYDMVGVGTTPNDCEFLYIGWFANSKNPIKQFDDKVRRMMKGKETHYYLLEDDCSGD